MKMSQRFGGTPADCSVDHIHHKLSLTGLVRSLRFCVFTQTYTETNNSSLECTERLANAQSTKYCTHRNLK